MSRRSVELCLAFGVFTLGCSSVAGLVGIDANPITIDVATTILVGDTVQATAISHHRNGNLVPVTGATWRTSDASVISVDANGRLVGHIENRQATIFADFEGATGSVVVSVRADDKRFGYALADQPTVAGPYSPDATYRYNSSGGAIAVTRDSTGAYSVRIAGLGRDAGARDNVQVTGYGTPGVYCKPRVWTSSGSDMIVPVACYTTPSAELTDSRFTILLMGARPFGPTTVHGFALAPGDTGTVVLDTSSTARNSAGGHIYQGHVSEGAYAMQFQGLGKASGSGPLSIQVTAVGGGPRRCRLIATDIANDGLGINCSRAGSGAPGDSPFSVLWFTRGRPNLRYGFAWANNAQATSNYTPTAPFAASSSGGAITSRRTGTGTYQVVFAGLARPQGATENVQLSPAWEDSTGLICNITSWGNVGADLAVNVACYDLLGAPANGRFEVLVVE